MHVYRCWKGLNFLTKLNSDLILKFFFRDKDTWNKLGFISKDEEPYSCCMWHALGELYGTYGPEVKDYSNESLVKFIKPYLNNDIISSMSIWECDEEEDNEEMRKILALIC